MLFPAVASAASPLFWLCLVVALWPILLVSILLHEAGHAVAGRLAGYRIVAWGMGTDDPLWVHPPTSRAAQTRFFLCRRQPLHGLTGAVYPGLLPTRRQAALLLSAGAFTNLLLALLGLLLLTSAAGVWRPISISLVLANALLCIMALIPGARQSATDGTQLLRLFSARGIRQRATSPETLRVQAPLWKAVGATALLQFDRLSAVVAALETGDNERARTHLEEADQRPAETAPLIAYSLLVQGLLYEAEGSNDACACFEQAQQWYEQNHHAGGAYLAQIYAAGTDVARLNALNHAPGIAPFPLLRTLLAFRLLRAISSDASTDTAALMTAVSRYQSARLQWRSDIQDAVAFTLAAHRLRQHGDITGATPLEAQAQVAVAQVRFALADHPDLRDAFAARLERALTTR